MLVALFSQVCGKLSSLAIDFFLLQCAAARNMLEGAGDLKRKWTWAVEWLHDELERGGGHRWLVSTPRVLIFHLMFSGHLMQTQPAATRLQTVISLSGRTAPD